VIPGRIIDPEPDKPAEEQVVLEPLHQLAFGADGIEGLQEHGPEQLLGRDGGPADAGVKRRKLLLQSREGLVHKGSDGPQRVIGPHPLLQIHVAEQLARPLVDTSHPSAPRPMPRRTESRSRPPRERVFHQPATVCFQSQTRMEASWTKAR